MRRSSSTGASWLTSNGGVLAALRTTAALASTSMSPVSRLGLAVPSGRGRTVPVICATHSARKRSATLNASGASSGWKTTCTRPVLSRRSMKTRPPWSRRRCNHPAREMVCPACSRRRLPQPMDFSKALTSPGRLMGRLGAFAPLRDGSHRPFTLPQACAAALSHRHRRRGKGVHSAQIYERR